MSRKGTIDASVEEFIMAVVKDEKPETTNQLVKLVQQRYPLTEEEITNLLVRLENEGKVRFTAKEPATQLTPVEYVLSSKATWFWTTLGLALATLIAVFAIPEDAYPIVYIRYALGSVFVLWLPGFTLMKALYPTNKEMDDIERASLSIGLSLALIALVGLLLNYTPFGIRLAPVVLSLLALTTVFAVAAVVREHQTGIASGKTR